MMLLELDLIYFVHVAAIMGATMLPETVEYSFSFGTGNWWLSEAQPLLTCCKLMTFQGLI